MAFSGIVAVLYMIDILYYTVIDDSWGIGETSSKYRDRNGSCPGCRRQLPIHVMCWDSFKTVQMYENFIVKSLISPKSRTWMKGSFAALG